MKFSDSVRVIKGVGTSAGAGLASLGVSTVGELLRFYPRAYEDWSNILPIAQCPIGENVCIKARLLYPIITNTVRGGMKISKGTITDGDEVISVVFFNNKYISSMLKADEEYLFFGKITLGQYAAREMRAPLFLKPEKSKEIRPIYPQNKQITSRKIQSAVEIALKETPEAQEYLPAYITEKYGLISLDSAIRQIHFPKSPEDLQKAKNRLIFDELFILQLSLLTLREQNSEVPTSNIVTTDYSAEFFSLLPFEPTNAQKRAVSEALSDMQSGRQMNRLLQGDVGSGKTAVAAALIYSGAKNGFQSGLMAPTEILAVQHYETFMKLFKGTGIRCALLTGSTKAAQKRQIKEELSKGELDLVIGTHALIQNDVFFKRLGLVITDEQHRFGVKQRTGLCAKGENPHIFVMSATPIPRTLALILFGDLQVSVLDELPPGRQKTETHWLPSKKRGSVLNFIRERAKNGSQAYIVCPLVEESEEISGVLSVEAYYEQLTKLLPDCKTGLLHGQMTAAEKDSVMSRFKAGEIDILVSTVVIEVGVDVPNATVMVIENAERFGLSQLHQLRGRVGRGSEKSYCLLISDSKGEETAARLNVMCQTTDGFKIADEDLKLRGPGDFFGTRQHGLPKLRIADLMTDSKVLMQTRTLAGEIMLSDPNFNLPEHKKIGALTAKKLRSLQVPAAANTI